MDSPTDVLPSVLRWLGRDPNASGAEDRAARGAGESAAVGIDDGVLSEQIAQGGDVAGLRGAMPKLPAGRPIGIHAAISKRGDPPPSCGKWFHRWH